MGHHFCCTIVQLVERYPLKLVVLGSSPNRASIYGFLLMCPRTQTAKRTCLKRVDFGGSTPPAGTKFASVVQLAEITCSNQV